jgi:hypothetical protein
MFQSFTVATPVANITNLPHLKSSSLETQCLIGEKLLGIDLENGFVLVQVKEQLKFYPASLIWGGYFGFVRKENLVQKEYIPNARINSFDLKLSFGSQVFISKEKECFLPSGESFFIRPYQWIPLTQKERLCFEGRERILSWGNHFLGAPYLWGGRSAFLTRESSCDCSGLVHLLYQQEGICLPRDAHDQFLFSKMVSYEELKPADLIFLSSGDRVHHVMLFIEGDLFLEATGGQVREVVISSGEKKLGKRLDKIKNGEKVGVFRVFFKSV